MRMMRSISGRKRKTDKATADKETWVTWIKESTNEAKEAMKKNKIQD